MRFAAAIVGGITGAVILSILTVAFHWLFFRPALGDGQYGFVFFVTVPVGLILGALTGLAFALWWQNQTAAAGWLCAVGGAALGELFLYLGWFVLSGTENPTPLERLQSAIFWFFLPLLWAGALVAAGLRALYPR